MVLAGEPPPVGASDEPSVQAEPPAAQPAPPAPVPAAPAQEPPRIAPPDSTGLSDRADRADRAAAPRGASEQREARFGDPGQFVLSGALSASFGHLGYSTGDNTTTSFGIEPAFDYFSTQNFFEGASAFIRYSDGTSGIGIESKSLSLGVTGQIGFNFWLGDRVSFCPKLSLGVWQTRTTYEAPSFNFTVSIDGLAVPLGPSTEVTENAVFVQLYAPFLFHLAQHFFIGFGPDVYTDLLHSVESASNRRIFLGASSTVGGWF